jgi:hypothetical protein
MISPRYQGVGFLKLGCTRVAWSLDALGPSHWAFNGLPFIWTSFIQRSNLRRVRWT